MIYIKAFKSELNSKQESHSFDLVLTLVLAPTKADPTVKEQSCKQVTVENYGTGGIETILNFLSTFLVAFCFRAIGFSLEE